MLKAIYYNDNDFGNGCIYITADEEEDLCVLHKVFIMLAKDELSIDLCDYLNEYIGLSSIKMESEIHKIRMTYEILLIDSNSVLSWRATCDEWEDMAVKTDALKNSSGNCHHYLTEDIDTDNLTYIVLSYKEPRIGVIAPFMK